MPFVARDVERGLAKQHARVIHQHIEMAKHAESLLHASLDAGLGTHIQGERQAAHAVGTDLCKRVTECIGIQFGDGDIVTITRQYLGDGGADAGSGPELPTGGDVGAGPADVPAAADGVAQADVTADGFFDDPDAGAVDAGSPAPLGLGTLYAHTSSVLYKLDASGFVKVGAFQFDSHPGSMTDIALDMDGVLWGVTFNDLFTCDKATAQCNWLAGLPGSFNGLTFVPKGTVDPSVETLIGVGTDGSWNAIEIGRAHV